MDFNPTCIKKICAGCSIAFEETDEEAIERYELYGNFCAKCVSRVNRTMHKKEVKAREPFSRQHLKLWEEKRDKLLNNTSKS